MLFTMQRIMYRIDQKEIECLKIDFAENTSGIGINLSLVGRRKSQVISFLFF